MTQLSAALRDVPQVNPATSLEIAFGSFASRCDSLNLSKGTVIWYGYIIRDLRRFLTEKGLQDAPQVTSGVLREYLSGLRARGQSSETVFRTWGALKAVFRFMLREGHVPNNPMEHVERPRRERRRIRPLSMIQVRALLEQPDLATIHGLRDRAMMLLMVDSGLRLSEVLGLELNRIDWEERQATVLGKGRRERLVPLGQHSLKALEDYLQVRGAGGSLVFIGRGPRPLNSRTVQLKIKNYGLGAGIEGVRMSPHTLRHTFAIQWIRNDGDIFSLQAILGHATLEMVRNYVNLAQQDVAVKHRKYSPVDRLLGEAHADPA